MVPPPFDPRSCKYGLYPYVPPNEHPIIGFGSTGNQVGYLQAVLKCKSGQSIYIAALPGPWYFGTSTVNGLKNFQTFWGVPADGVTDPQTWGLINWAAKGFPT